VLAIILHFHPEKCHETDAVEPIMCPPWSTRLSKMMQPNLDFTAPEIQTCSNCSILSDMFSLGMVICTIFNNGKPLILSQNSPSAYLKQLELVITFSFINATFDEILPRRGQGSEDLEFF
jgi:serine/threonine protein kinase